MIPERTCALLLPPDVRVSDQYGVHGAGAARRGRLRDRRPPQRDQRRRVRARRAHPPVPQLRAVRLGLRRVPGQEAMSQDEAGTVVRNMTSGARFSVKLPPQHCCYHDVLK